MSATTATPGPSSVPESRASTSPNRIIGGAFGIIYLLVGIAGFFVTSGVDFIARRGDTLIIFEVNPLHNIVHLGIGAALLLAALKSVPASKAVNLTVGAVYLIVGIVGLFILESNANILALNGADNVLHFGSALLLLGVGLGADRAARSNTA